MTSRHEPPPMDHLSPEKSVELLRGVLRVTDVALERMALDELLDALLDRLIETVHVDTATVLLCTADHGALVVRASRGLEAEIGESIVVPMGQGLAGRVAASREAIIVDDVSRVDVFRPSLKRLRSMMVAPLESDHEVVGVVHVGSLHGRRFTDPDLHLLRMVASRVGRAIERAQLRGESGRSHEEHRLLAEVGHRLAESLEPAEALRVLAEALCPALGDFVITYQLEEPAALRRVAAVHRDPELRELTEELLRFDPIDMESTHPAIGALRSGETVLLEALPDDFYRAPMVEPRQAEIFLRIGTRSAVISPLRARGRILGVVAIGRGDGRLPFAAHDVPLAREVADRAGLALDNARLFQRADAANRAKGEFLAVMSHELRTPLTSILGFCELLTRHVRGGAGADEIPTLDYLERIRRNASQLVGIIDEILTFASTEDRTARVRLSTFDPRDLVREVARAIEPDAMDKGLEVQVAVPAGALEVRSDREKVRQILLNLARNAVKFTDSGHVGLELEATGEGLRFRVRDTGPGIFPADRERVFEPFTQADQSSARPQEGTGLGLPVSRRLAELLGGDLLLERASGAGSAFRFHLPPNVPSEAIAE